MDQIGGRQNISGRRKCRVPGEGKGGWSLSDKHGLVKAFVTTKKEGQEEGEDTTRKRRLLSDKCDQGNEKRSNTHGAPWSTLKRPEALQKKRAPTHR